MREARNLNANTDGQENGAAVRLDSANIEDKPPDYKALFPNESNNQSNIDSNNKSNQDEEANNEQYNVQTSV